jgi:hypothetical protein
MPALLLLTLDSLRFLSPTHMSMPSPVPETPISITGSKALPLLMRRPKGPRHMRPQVVCCQVGLLGLSWLGMGGHLSPLPHVHAAAGRHTVEEVAQLVLAVLR